jgi:opacity protein-like surface antigen
MTGGSVRVVGCVALLIVSSLQAAAAGERGFYAGFFYDHVDSPLTQAPFDEITAAALESVGFSPQTSTASFDLNENGYSFVVGYRLFDHFALEGGYMDLGKATYRYKATGSQFTIPSANATVNLKASTSGLTLAALGILPLNYRWEVFGRAGVLFAGNDLSIFFQDIISAVSDRGNQRTTNFVAGAGVGYTLADIYTLRAEYQRVFGYEAALLGVKDDVDQVTIGLTVRF